MPARNEFLAYRVWPLVSLLVILTVPSLIVWAAANPLLERTMTEALIMVVLVVGMQVFIGNSGVVSFGHVSFVAVAAYAAAWQTCCPAFKAAILPGLPAFLAHTQIPTIPSILAAIALAGVVGFLIGLPIIRLTGIGASIAMFAVLSIVQTTYSNWDSVTGGESSIIGLPTYVDLPVALLGAAIAIAAAHVYKASRFGLMLRASRDDEVAARAAGIDVYWQRLLAFSVSAVIVGFGGVLHAHFIGVVSIDAYWIQLTFITLAMLVVGGMRSLAGAVVGALVISALVEILRQFESGIDVAGLSIVAPRGVQEIGLAVLLLIILIARPSGITGGNEITIRWPRRLHAASSGSGP